MRLFFNSTKKAKKHLKQNERDVPNLIYLSPDELLVPAEVLRRHEVLNDVDQRPERVLLVHEEQGDRSDPVETLQKTEKRPC
jgi:hypothetical protein